jgi:hypothetical protein
MNESSKFFNKAIDEGLTIYHKKIFMKTVFKSLIYRSGKCQWEICQELNWPEAKLSRFVTGRRKVKYIWAKCQPQ